MVIQRQNPKQFKELKPGDTFMLHDGCFLELRFALNQSKQH